MALLWEQFFFCDYLTFLKCIFALYWAPILQFDAFQGAKASLWSAKMKSDIELHNQWPVL